MPVIMDEQYLPSISGNSILSSAVLPTYYSSNLYLRKRIGKDDHVFRLFLNRTITIYFFNIYILFKERRLKQ